MNKIISLLLIISLTLLSGLADSQGFIHASLMWKKGKIVWDEFIKSSAGFGLGIISYWLIIRYLNEFKIVTPEIQSIGWFAVAIIGVAIASGKFLYWQRIDQLVALGVFVGIGWLIFHTST